MPPGGLTSRPVLLGRDVEHRLLQVSEALGARSQLVRPGLLLGPGRRSSGVHPLPLLEVLQADLFVVLEVPLYQIVELARLEVEATALD